MEGQYVAYSFFRIVPAWRRLPIEERAAGKDAFAEVVEDWAPRMDALRAYSLTGVRPDSDFFLWKITQRYEDLGELGAALNGTPLAGWLETPYSYLATTKASEYTKARRARKVVPKDSPYLVVYPFVKTRPWYALPAEDRQRAMEEHMRLGAEFESIHNHTTYSFGIDDQERSATRRSLWASTSTSERRSTRSTANGRGSRPSPPPPGHASASGAAGRWPPAATAARG